MKRHYLLIAGCLLGAVSVGFNIHLYRQRHASPSKEIELTVPAEGSTVFDRNLSSGSSEKTAESEGRTFPAMPQVKFDFSDTAFADGSWKLTESAPALDLEKPFVWEDVNPARTTVDPDNPFGVDPPKIRPALKDSVAGTPAKIDGKTAQPPPPTPPK